MQRDLPIWQIHSGIISVLKPGNRLVLVAPTGSGKSTQLPQMLLDAGLIENEPERFNRGATGGADDSSKIVVLQPRRVAARTVAARVAWERGVNVGGEVGYQIRFEDQTSLGTRISYVTEGILLRWLQRDPELRDVGIVVFDEFHERNLLSDVALALAKQLQQTRRPDLKLIVMSATLEAEPVARYLDDCPVLISEGQSHPVEIRYLDHRDERLASDQAAGVVERIVNSGAPGDILVFMPGMGEINATIHALRAARLHERLALIPLHGDLEPKDQDRAFAPNPLRKVVIATNVAETSVTIDGILHVVDSGLARVARFDAHRGIQTLLIEEISRTSADQRKGRAGRTAPGTCYRLWTESGHLNRPERNTPEIQRGDLAEVVLLLHSLGIKKAAAFDWLDKPELDAVERAEQLLKTLGALSSGTGRAGAIQQQNPASAIPPDSLPLSPSPEETGRALATIESDLTPIGRRMLRLPMHPRYSRMLVEAAARDCVPAAALCAALVSGRDLLTRLGRGEDHISNARELFETSQDSDFLTLIRAYQFAKNHGFSLEQCRRHGIHAQTARQVEQTFEQILQIAQREQLQERRSETPPGSGEPDTPLLRCLMAGFIDQLCVRRNLGTLDCALTEGRTGTLARESVARNATLLVVASIREIPSRSGALTLLGLATAVKREWIEETFSGQVTVQVEHLYDRIHKRVAAVKVMRFHDLVIHQEHERELDPNASGRSLAEASRNGHFELPLFNHEIKQFIARVNLASSTLPELEFPAFDEPAIVAALARAFFGLSLAKEAREKRLHEAFRQHLAPEQLEWLDELAPVSIPWPGGRVLKLTYADEPRGGADLLHPPEAQVKLQECFALHAHPNICENKMPVKLWLCAPDGKRLESTTDWPRFKANAYGKLIPVLRRKFPGVPWI